MKRKISLPILMIGVLAMSMISGAATVQATTVIVPVNTGSFGKGLNPGDVDPNFTWNKTGDFSDPRFQAYVFNNFNPLWCPAGFPQTLTCNINQGFCNAKTNLADPCTGSDFFLPLFGPDVPAGTTDQGIEFYYLTFDLPAGVTNVKLDFSVGGLMAADDRLQFQLNGNVIGYWGGSGGTGRMDGLGSQPSLTGVVFNANNANRPVVTNQSLFNIGGQNVVRFWVNNTFTTSVGAAARPRGPGDPSALAVRGTLSYDETGLDHFLLYTVKTTKDTPAFEERVVTLEDQFDEPGQSRVFEVKKVKRLGNPADKNGEGISDPETHLVGYNIKRDKGEPAHVPVTGITVTNQFGSLSVDTVVPKLLLVPSAKDLDEPVPPLEAPGTDHFKCYAIQITEGTPAFVPTPVTVVDQFEQSKLYDVLQPVRLCNPVDKNGEGIASPDDHLVCYEVLPAAGAPEHVRVNDIHIDNQFGPLQLDALDGNELCVPSEKQLGGL